MSTTRRWFGERRPLATLLTNRYLRYSCRLLTCNSSSIP
jgi:hypothetical protein